jgi:ribonuclease VapC
MIVDTSAIIAFLFEEPERVTFTELMGHAERVLLSAGNWVELAAVLRRPTNESARESLSVLMREMRVQLVPVSSVQARIGHDAYLIYGKGNHEANLNFGDCFAYALSKETGLPLLFKGDDFSKTDVVSAI